jgi:hypothetical protein
MTRLLTVLFVVAVAPMAAGQTIDFTSIPAGTPLDGQLATQGLRFVVQDGVGAITDDVAGVRVARFDKCQANSGCEFVSSRGHLVFSDPQSSAILHVGLTSVNKGTRATVRFTAVDAGQNPVAVVTKSLRMPTGTQVEVALMAPSAAPVIAGVIFEVVDLPTLNAAVLVRDIALQAPSATVPDFQVLSPAPVTLLTKGAPVDVQIQVVRTTASTGPIQIALSAAIPGVSVQLLDDPFAGTTTTVRLTAANNVPPHHFQAQFTLTPGSPSAGAASRTVDLGVEVADPLQILAPLVVDAATCTLEPDGVTTTLSIPIQVRRYWSIAGPIGVGVSSSGAGLTFTPSTIVLNFPGNIIVDGGTLKANIVSGVDIPDVLLTFNAGNTVAQTSALALVHGTCPRHTQSFLAKGRFECNDRGVIAPVKFARVDLFRSVDFWFDDWYGSTVTDGDGRYSFPVITDTSGSYYARLRLVGSTRPVSLRDSWSDQPWTLGTDAQPNTTGQLDFGNIQISRNGGSSTPKCAIFEGGRFAFEEEATTLQAIGAVPPQPRYDLVIWRGFISPISYRLNTDWPDKQPVIAEDFVNKPTGHPADVAKNLQASLHEFGHTYRHYLDGGTDHFNHDSTVYFYGRAHGYCDITNPGFAFNEGWAEYWSMEPKLRATHARGTALGPCDVQPLLGGSGPIGVDDSTGLQFQVEGLVAEDLMDLESCTGIGRAGMAKVLMAAGPEAIHSQVTFRQQLSAQFPSADLSKCTRVAKGLGILSAHKAVTTAAARARRAAEIQRDIDALNTSIRALATSVTGADRSATLRSQCVAADCEARFRAAIRPAILRGQQSFARLMIETLRYEASRLKEEDPSATAYDPHRQLDVRIRTLDFDSRRREIVASVLKEAHELGDAAARLAPGLAGTSSRADLERRLKMLNTNGALDEATLSLIKLPIALDDDRGRRARSR